MFDSGIREPLDWLRPSRWSLADMGVALFGCGVLAAGGVLALLAAFAGWLLRGWWS